MVGVVGLFSDAASAEQWSQKVSVIDERALKGPA